MSCLVVSFALALAAVTPDGETGERERALVAEAGSAASRDAAAAAVLSLVNRIAIATGTVADARARAPAVRALAARIQAAHSAEQQRLVAWIARNPVTASLLEHVVRAEGAEHLRLPAWLRTVPAARFDRIYLRALLEMDARGLRFLAAAQSAASDAALVRLLEASADRIRAHQADTRLLLGPARREHRRPPAPGTGAHSDREVARGGGPRLGGG